MSTSVLSSRQKDELYVFLSPFACASLARVHGHRHKAMLDYLHANNFHKAYDSLKEETGLNPDPNAQYTGLLEKKWTSVIRLQKRVRLNLYMPTSGINWNILTFYLN
jgi:hypothetical protein